MGSATTDDKRQVTEYFNGTGFARWNAIYSDAAEVNAVQAQIRRGHAQTVQTVLEWLSSEPASSSVLDAGCGVGSLAHPLAQRGHEVHGVDISAAMVAEAERRADSGATFSVGDLDAIERDADVVCCVDVLIHYPSDEVSEMIKRLATHARRRIVLSFAPSTPFYDLLKMVGSFFPGPSKATRAYLHREELVRKALADAGFQVQRSTMCKTNFYFSQVFDALRAPDTQ